MEFMEANVVPTNRSAVRRIQALGTRWRVSVESWPVRGGWGGRLAFDPDLPSAFYNSRTTAPTLFGRTHAEILEAAHIIPERRLLALLHSFG